MAKLFGKSLTPPTHKTIVIPHGDSEIVFKCKAVLDFTEFDAICPRPMPPTIMRPGQPLTPNFEDVPYKESLDVYIQRRTDWMFLESLSATEGFEFETVDRKNPDTWSGWSKELKDIGFSALHINKLIDTCMDACGLNSDKIDQATKRFLAGAAAKANA